METNFARQFYLHFQFFLEDILLINLSGKETYHAYVISDNCCRPYRYRHVETPYRIISFGAAIFEFYLIRIKDMIGMIKI
jgi:hypothetical protein